MIQNSVKGICAMTGLSSLICKIQYINILGDYETCYYASLQIQSILAIKSEILVRIAKFFTYESNTCVQFPRMISWKSATFCS